LIRRLGDHEWVAAGEYTIADMAIFPWCRLAERQRQDINDFPNVKRWFEQIAARPAVARDMEKTEDIVDGFDPESWDVSFGATQYDQR
jgi:GST-like protein